ncbi:MAG: glycosyltransferase family 4 protein [Chloroflexi bacterium]|nr:glycosyltransferase family 4 protein [Chloroflexota bacterium]
MSDALRVFLDARTLTWSGVGRYVKGLIESLAARDDIDLTVFHYPKDRLPVTDGIKTVEASAGVFSPKGLVEVSLVARRYDYDLFHAPMFITPYAIKKPLVVTIHDLIPLTVPDVMPGFAERRLYYTVNKRAAKIANAILVPSQSTKDDVAKFLECAPLKVHIVSHAMDPEFSSLTERQDSAILLKLGIGEPYVLSMGNEKPSKNIVTLVQAFSLVRAMIPLKLVLVGAPTERFAQVQDAIADLDLQEYVLYTGHVSDEELVALYSNALVFVFPSIYEGFGLPPLEAMTYGTPVACSSTTSLPEVVGNAAELFDPFSADDISVSILKLATDSSLRKDMIDRGHERARQFNWQNTSSGIVEVYRQAINLKK